MSDSTLRESRSKRRYATEVKCIKQKRIATSKGLSVSSPHKFAKKHAMNCGNPTCVMCMNPRKAFGEKTIQEQKFLQRERIVDEQPS